MKLIPFADLFVGIQFPQILNTSEQFKWTVTIRTQYGIHVFDLNSHKTNSASYTLVFNNTDSKSPVQEFKLMLSSTHVVTTARIPDLSYRNKLNDYYVSVTIEEFNLNRDYPFKYHMNYQNVISIEGTKPIKI